MAEIRTCQRFYACLIDIRKFDQLSIENKVVVPGTTFPPL